jgi:hypothetical protein
MADINTMEWKKSLALLHKKTPVKGGPPERYNLINYLYLTSIKYIDLEKRIMYWKNHSERFIF